MKAVQKGTDMKLTVMEISIHPDNENPVFGERAVQVRLDDEAGGPFVKIIQSTDEGIQEIRLDFDEVEHIVKAIEMLKAGANYE